MTITAYFSAPEDRWPLYKDPLRAAFAEAGLDVDLSPDCADPSKVDYLIFGPRGPVTDFTAFTNTRLVMNLWAGVETIVGNPTLTQPLARMVDNGLTEGMVEYVTGHVLRHHLNMDRYIHGVPWDRCIPPIARWRKVTILGLGELGTACATTLAGLNFQVAGWSRRPKSIPGVTCLHGEGGLEAALKRAEIIVLLLPLTAATSDLVDAGRLALLPKGAVILNPGRGGLIVDDDLLAALDTGHVGHATLDAFRVEPLPEDHRYWSHDRVTITPHIASESRPETAAPVIAENIRRGEAGEDFLHLVDRTAGY